MYATLTIPANLEALEQLTPFIGSVTKTASPHLRVQLALAVHELCVNIVQHAYAGAPGKIILNADCDEHGLHLSIYDTGPNVYRQSERPSPEPLDLPESGWGLVILRRTMDDVSYTEHLGGHVWHLAKVWAKEVYS